MKVCPLATRDLVERILFFTEKFSGIKLYLYQKLFAQRIIDSVLIRDGATVTGLFSRQSGKSSVVADLVVSLAIILPTLSKAFPDDDRLKPFTHGFLVGIYAPIEQQAAITYERMRDRVQKSPGKEILLDPEINVKCTRNTGEQMKFDNGSIIIARSASPNSSIEGQTHHLALLDEGQLILRSKVEKGIRPMLSSKMGSMVVIGTAGESRGGFHQSIATNLELHKRTGVRNHFEFPYDIVIQEKKRAYDDDKNPDHLSYERFINNEIQRLGGVDSDEFKMNYRCLWQESNIIAIKPEVWKAAANPTIEMAPPANGLIVGGLDVGKLRDRTVLCALEIDLNSPVINTVFMPGAEEEKQIYYRKTIRDLLEIGGAFEGYDGQYALLVRYLQLTNIQVLVVDASGLGGDVIFERIEAMVGDRIQCVPYKFTGMSKSNLYKYYLQELNSRRLTYAAGPQTLQRLEFLKFQQEHLDLDKVEHAGYAVCQAPEGGHDDYPDACALACWAEKLQPELVIPEIIVTTANDGQNYQSGPGLSAQHRGGRYSRRW